MLSFTANDQIRHFKRLSLVVDNELTVLKDSLHIESIRSTGLVVGTPDVGDVGNVGLPRFGDEIKSNKVVMSRFGDEISCNVMLVCQGLVRINVK